MSDKLLEAFGGDEPKQEQLLQKIGEFSQKVGDIADSMKAAKDEDTARYQSLREELATTSNALTEMKAQYDRQKREEEVQAAIEMAAEWKKAAENTRSPSKLADIAAGAAKALDGYEPGSFIKAVGLSSSRDFEEQQLGKAELRAKFQHAESQGKASLNGGPGGSQKATVGLTDATGGWIIPNAIVDDLIVPAQVTNIYRQLMTVRSGVTAATIDQPVRLAARTRAAVATFGATKENVNLVYNGYTVTMYTLARIYDIGNQFLRQSAGAAEQDVLSELAAAFAQGESYYIREGSGTNEPFGYTSALTNGPATFRSSAVTTLSDSTLQGSIAANIANMAGVLAGRGVKPTAAVLSATVYWQMLRQGSDTAGFWFSTVANSPASINPGTLISPFGLPVYPDADADLEGTAAVIDNLVIADWKQFKLWFGQDYRVDSSDQAGTRWDTNLTGFRGEEEMGFDARSAVYAGYAQMLTDVTP